VRQQRNWASAKCWSHSRWGYGMLSRGRLSAWDSITIVLTPFRVHTKAVSISYFDQRLDLCISIRYCNFFYDWIVFEAHLVRSRRYTPLFVLVLPFYFLHLLLSLLLVCNFERHKSNDHTSWSGPEVVHQWIKPLRIDKGSEQVHVFYFGGSVVRRWNHRRSRIWGHKRFQDL